MDKQPVGQLPDLASSNNDDEIMVITDSEHNQLKKEKISDLITDFTSTNENNALTKGTDGKMFVTDFGNASNITEGTLPVSVLPDIPKDLLPAIETTDLPASGVAAGTYTYPTDIVVNSKGQVTSITEGQAGANNANQDLSNLSEAGENHFANPDLSNLTAEGEKHFLNKRQITNCILEAPRRVKIEMNGTTITIKAGSRLSFPNGFDIKGDRIFDEVILENDVSSTSTPPGSYQAALGVVKNDIGNYYINYIGPLDGGTNYPATYSGPTQPVSGAGQYAFWYNTTQNKVFMVESGSVNTDNYATFPIAYISVTAGGFQGVHQYYDVCSYCGQYLLTFPNVKYLIPNGYYEDGSLKSIEVITNTTLSDFTNKASYYLFLNSNGGFYNWSANNTYFVGGDNAPAISTQYATWYDMRYSNHMQETHNKGANWNYIDKIYAGTMVKEPNGNIQGIYPAEPVNLVKMDDYNALQNRINGMKTYVTTTYVNGNTWYRIWSDGWKEQGGRLTGTGDYNRTVTFPLAFSNTNYIIVKMFGASGGGGTAERWLGFWNLTTNSAITGFTNRTEGWYACGY